ncbi:MAG: pilus assembly protein PilM [Anaerohalosphaeraceae bacterium]|nr:pilus assembly protein PilM [Anaerohalosphaeraceae bacterium]
MAKNHRRGVMFFDIFKNDFCPIGVELGPEKIRMSQLVFEHGQVKLVAGNSELLPHSITPYNGQWQRNAIETLKSMCDSTPFKSKNVVTAIHPSDVFTREIKVPASSIDNIEDVVLREVAKIVPFRADGALVKHIVLNGSQTHSDKNTKNVLVMATEKSTVEKHLVIFEKASLKVKAITIWPAILVECYSNFFGRRRADIDVNVILINACENYCNVVICRQNKVLFARTIQNGLHSLEKETGREKLTAEVNACIRHFQSSRRNDVVEKIILLGSSNTDKRLCDCIESVAKKQSLPAHYGDILKAVSDDHQYQKGIDRRCSTEDWTIPFGLSLAGKNLR